MGFEEDTARFTVRAGTNMAFGQGGRTYTNDTTDTLASEHDCDFYHTIVCLEDTVFSVLTDATLDGNTEVGTTFTMGTFIYGVITRYKLTSGAVHAYKAKNANTGGE